MHRSSFSASSSFPLMMNRITLFAFFLNFLESGRENIVCAIFLAEHIVPLPFCFDNVRVNNCSNLFVLSNLTGIISLKSLTDAILFVHNTFLCSASIAIYNTG